MCGVFLMEILDFIIWLLTESFKNLMIPFGILGFSPKRGKLKWGIMIAGISLLIIVQNTGGDLFIAQIFYTFLIVIIFFQEIFGKKIQLFLLQFIAITSVDLLLWSILAGIVNKKLAKIGKKLAKISKRLPQKIVNLLTIFVCETMPTF